MPILVPTGIAGFKFSILDGDWAASDSAVTGSDFERYVYVPVPHRIGRLIRIKVDTDTEVNFEVLDFPGPVGAPDGPHAIFWSTAIAPPGIHIAEGSGAGIPVGYHLGESNHLHFSASILTVRLLVGASTANTFFSIYTDSH